MPAAERRSSELIGEACPVQVKLQFTRPEPARAPVYCFTNSTRRFLAFPSSLSLEATGESGPTP